ncbi:DUF1273 domain-containing protein [Dellaglioa sp. L3N]
MKRLWVTGYRTYELGIFNETDLKITIIKSAIKKYIINEIENGLEWVITGPQLGIEQWTVEVCLDIKKEYPDFKVALMLPFREFGNNWKDDKKITLNNLLSDVDFTDNISKDVYQSPQQLKNYQAFMIDHTDGALLVYDSENEGKTKFDLLKIKQVKESRDYGLQMIDFMALEDVANEIEEERNNHLNY